MTLDPEGSSSTFYVAIPYTLYQSRQVVGKLNSFQFYQQNPLLGWDIQENKQTNKHTINREPERRSS
jgi:hypothetical protein